MSLIRRRRDRAHARLILFSILLALLLAAALFARSLCPLDPNVQDLSIVRQAPSAAHWLGTDRFGRDVFSRVLAGSTVSIYAALALTAVTAVTGTAIGLLCGWLGGWLDTVLMRLSDLFLAFPTLVFALAVAGVLGGGIHNAVIALAAISWPKFARLARSLTIAQREAPYLMAARLAGCSPAGLLLRHVLPNILGQILVAAVLDLSTMMMELAGLSFLGLGVKPPMAEWGSMIDDGRSLLQTAPWMVLAPVGAVFLTVTVFSLFGDALRDVMDPRRQTS
ncbi:ABC transporter permease [Pseudoflavonifractor sp. MSJ-37]|uniref:ABC transporter permease n=1 Tax=Pseudoflavonifractor sp. MSJ-37 TaxID=2841531 RepID=UPI001C10DB20|nr:ABC transporter permease [Pseudoflavonifractor sp. MSJ-37]MBU5436161.1 ABC transporter permease [Pseudoflavonifractor sp. MSJ-37]